MPTLTPHLTTLRAWADRDPDRVAMDAAKYPDLPVREMAVQLRLRRKAVAKLPEWAGTDVLFTERALEQSSGEVAAKHKRKWLKGRVIDLSGGLGSDLIHSADQIAHMVYCDIDPEMCELFRHNAGVLGVRPDAIHNGDGIATLAQYPDGSFDVIYVDPDRRAGKGRSVSLQDASPDVTAHLDMMLDKGSTLLVKASPALDPTEAERQLPGLKEYHVVSVEGEVKEVLLFVDRGWTGPARRVATVIKSDGHVEIVGDGRAASTWKDGMPSIFCEPDPAVIRAGLTSELAVRHGLQHVSPGSVYLVGSIAPAGFPGRVLSVDDIIPANFRSVKAWCKERGIQKANIARRDFPEQADAIRKSLKLKDGGNTYLFFTKWQGGYACVACSK